MQLWVNLLCVSLIYSCSLSVPCSRSVSSIQYMSRSHHIYLQVCIFSLIQIFCNLSLLSLKKILLESSITLQCFQVFQSCSFSWFYTHMIWSVFWPLRKMWFLCPIYRSSFKIEINWQDLDTTRWQYFNNNCAISCFLLLRDYCWHFPIFLPQI